MKTNVPNHTPPVFTAEGGVASKITPEQVLRRSVMSCMLWESNFYEDGSTIADRIKSLIPLVKPETVALMAIEAAEDMKLRHVPLLIVREMAKLPTHKHLVAMTLERVIRRADSLAEFLSLYWLDGKCPVSNQVKKGLGNAFKQFDEYALAKYDRAGRVRLRDVLFVTHPKPQDKAQERLWKRLVDNKLKTPDTWEVALSASKGEDKKAVWTRLLKEGKIPAFAFIRNLRNFVNEGVSKDLVRETFKTLKTERLLPFNFVTAARFCPDYEPELEKAMLECLGNQTKIPGKTILLVDVSGSMDTALSSKSETTCVDAAAGLAILAREMFEDIEIITFSNDVVKVPARHGFALRDAIKNSQHHGGTELGKAISQINVTHDYDRLIVFTDEQSHDSVGKPKGRGYIINVSTNRNGVGYGAFTHVDGFSEHVINYITTVEGINVPTKRTLTQAEKARHTNGYRVKAIKAKIKSKRTSHKK